MVSAVRPKETGGEDVNRNYKKICIERVSVGGRHPHYSQYNRFSYLNLTIYLQIENPPLIPENDFCWNSGPELTAQRAPLGSGPGV